MRGWLSTILCSALVCGGAIAAKLIASSSWESVVGYKTPYVFHSNEPPGDAIVNRVMLVVLDGLRLDTSRELPALNKLRAQGADFTVRVGLPSLSNPARAVMATGAWQEVNGVTNNSHYTPPAADSIFSSARRLGVPFALAGIDIWRDTYGSMAAENFPKFGPEPHDQGTERILAYQRELCDGITGFVRRSKARLIVTDLTAIDIVSHDTGGASSDTKRVAADVDACLGRVAAEFDLSDSVLFVTSDHGHIDRGGHGGEERVVTNVPLVITGRGVVHAGNGKVNQTDIAPTICALLGLPFPSDNQGRVIFPAFDWPADTRAAINARLEHQRAAFRDVQKRVLGGDRETVLAAGEQARQTPAIVVFVLLALLGLGIFFGALDTWIERLCLAGGVAAYYAGYFVLFAAARMSYSLSSVNREEHLTRFLATGIVIAGLALILASPVMTFAYRRSRGGWPAAWRLGTTLSAFVCVAVASEVVLIYWSNGLSIGKWMFDLDLAFEGYLNLLALVSLPFAMTLSPFLVRGKTDRHRSTLQS